MEERSSQYMSWNGGRQMTRSRSERGERSRRPVWTSGVGNAPQGSCAGASLQQGAGAAFQSMRRSHEHSFLRQHFLLRGVHWDNVHQNNINDNGTHPKLGPEQLIPWVGAQKRVVR